MFRSATFKLTMWYLALVVAISLVFSIVLYRVATGELAYGLSRETARIFNQYPIFDNSPMLRSQPYDTFAAHRILLKLILFNIIVFFFSGFASYWLARRTLEPIEVAHEQQKRFTADVSHELRTPLTALKMESEVALMNPATNIEDLRETLESNLEEVAKLETLINNLLRLTRLEANELQHNFSSIDLQDVMNKVLEEAKKPAELRNIRLDTSINGGKLLGDSDSLVQMVYILVDNALKYSPVKSDIHIKSDIKDNQAIITIKDEGPGIDQASLKRVFDRFYRADNSRNKTEVNGFGLGLSIAKMIADIHNGDIVLSSRTGKGTTAQITIPTNNSIRQ
jgi:two-component system sensor histidine kinase CiaH